MPALGQKPTNGRQSNSTFVCFGPKADKRWRNWIVCQVSRSDVTAFRAANYFGREAEEFAIITI
jgi:hypothetical protein